MWELLSEVICTASSAEDLVEDDFSIFPNPFSKKINFEKTVEFVQIFNSTGQLVFQQKNTAQIETEFLPKGIYFLKIDDNLGQKSSYRIIKN